MDVRRRRVKEQAGVSLPKAHSRVDTDDFMKVGAEAPPKIPRPSYRWLQTGTPRLSMESGMASGGSSFCR